MKRIALAILAAFAFTPAMAEFSTKTHQAPPTVVITAVKDANGNATISWEGELRVVRVVHFVGDGKPTGKPFPIEVGTARSAVLKDVPKNGGVLNLIADDNLWLHLECGGNPSTTEPTLRGLRKDCSYTDKATGQKLGRLVVE